MITEDYVSFETAKLLKEKGFEGENRDWYNMEGFIEEIGVDDGIDPTAHEDIFNNVIPAPTLQMAMKWLREVHRLHVEVVPNPFNFEHQDIQDGWGCEVTHLSDLSYDGNYEFFQKKYSTYEQACESGIKYCLENLI